MPPAEPTVAELMTQTVVTVSPETSIATVLELAGTLDIHHFPITRGDHVVGLVCTCDLEHEPRAAPVQNAVRRGVVSVGPGIKARDAAVFMAVQSVGSVVVIDASGICGILTREDLAAADPETSAIVADSRCAACGSLKHVRPGPDGLFLCLSCESIARAEDWLEIGGGD